MNLLLVSDDDVFAKDLVSRLVFLRQKDAIQVSSYSEAFQNLGNAKVVLLHQNSVKQTTIDLISKLRSFEDLCIILLTSNADAVLEAYDAGINDFISETAPDFELVVRIVNNIKYNSFKNSVKRNEKILEQLGVINEDTGLYNYNFNIAEEFLKDKKGSVLVIKPKRTSKTFVKNFSQAVKNILRSPDLVMHGRNNNFYIVLPDTDVDGAIVVLEKIKAICSEKCKIHAGISEICINNFERTETKVLDLLADAVSFDKDYSYEEKKEETLDDWLNDTPNHNYKIFKQIFNKKLEKVIAPVFYRLQKTYEEKLFRVKIEQYVDSEQCVFKLKSKKQNSTLKIVYPGFAKILIQVVHDGLDSPENEELLLSLTKISQKELANIVENFILNYKAYIGEKNAKN